MNFNKTISASLLVLATITTANAGSVADKIAKSDAKDAAMSGKEIAETRKLGNCLACHMIPGGNLPGNIAPPLVAMKARFTYEKLRAQIWDPRTNNDHSMMPPFGANKILTPSQIDRLTKYIHSL
jgi:sulfur-oxidizing protein SoxX